MSKPVSSPLDNELRGLALSPEYLNGWHLSGEDVQAITATFLQAGWNEAMVLLEELSNPPSKVAGPNDPTWLAGYNKGYHAGYRKAKNERKRPVW